MTKWFDWAHSNETRWKDRNWARKLQMHVSIRLCVWNEDGERKRVINNCKLIRKYKWNWKKYLYTDRKGDGIRYGLIFGSFGRRTTWLYHFFHQIETDTSLRFIFHQWEIVEHIKMAKVGSIAVPVLISQPFPFICIRMSSSDVLRLQMFQLAVNVVSITHGDSDNNTIAEAAAAAAVVSRVALMMVF